MPKVNGKATAFCDSAVKYKCSPHGEYKGGPGCIGADPDKIAPGTKIKVYDQGTNTLIYEGVMCDLCGKATKVNYLLVDVWLPNENVCNNWGVKNVTIEY